MVENPNNPLSTIHDPLSTIHYPRSSLFCRPRRLAEQDACRVRHKVRHKSLPDSSTKRLVDGFADALWRTLADPSKQRALWTDPPRCLADSDTGQRSCPLGRVGLGG